MIRAALLTLLALFWLPEGRAKAEEPWAAWNLSEGDRLVFRRETGEVSAMTVESVTGKLAEVRWSNGCAAVMDLTGFGPWLEWKGCGGEDGKASLTRRGSIFPLRERGSEIWMDAKDRSKSRDCRVKGTRWTETPLGLFDSWIVECISDEHVRTTYFSKQFGIPVLLKRRDRKRGAPGTAYAFSLCALTLANAPPGLLPEDGQDRCRERSIAGDIGAYATAASELRQSMDLAVHGKDQNQWRER